MFFNLDDLGEKTLNKIAEIALSRQFQSVEKLSVRVKTDPNRLAKGELESLVINGTGLITSDRLRMQELKMTFNAIAVSPLKALMGNIELTYPSQGYAYVVFSEIDIERALLKQLQQSSLAIGESTANLDFKQVSCQIFANEEIDIALQVNLKETNENKQIAAKVKPRLNDAGKVIVLDEIQEIEKEEIFSSFTSILRAEAEKIFNLSLFQIDGIFLQVNRFVIEQGKIILKANAKITHFPTN